MVNAINYSFRVKRPSLTIVLLMTHLKSRKFKKFKIEIEKILLQVNNTFSRAHTSLALKDKSNFTIKFLKAI